MGGLRCLLAYYFDMLYDPIAIDRMENVVGWANFYDTNEIPALPSNLTTTESGLRIQDGMGLVRLDYIKALLPRGRDLEAFLAEIRRRSIVMVLNRVTMNRSLTNTGNALVSGKLIGQQLYSANPLINQSRFVGIRFKLKQSTGLRIILNRIGLSLSEPQTLTLYLFSSLNPTAVNTINLVVNNAGQFSWTEEDAAITIDVDAANSNSGAVWYLGYYQDDLVGRAYQYKTLNWLSGYCTSCGSSAYSSYHKTWKSISKHVEMVPFYVAGASLPPNRSDFFDEKDCVFDQSNNHGFNFNMSVWCNLTQYWIDNRLAFAQAIHLQTQQQILEMYKASSQSSGVEQNVQALALRELESDKDTKAMSLPYRIDKAIRAIRLDQGSTNDHPCLPCAKTGFRYSSM